MISIDIVGTDLILLTDNPTLPEIFKYDSGSMVFDFKTKQMVWGSKKSSIYESSRVSKKSGLTKIKFKIGWGLLILNMFKSYLSPDDKQKILDTIYSKNIRVAPFPNLRDYQNDDVLHLLKYKYGLFSCYTGYGKSEIIATLINYIIEETEDKVLILVPSIKCKDEIVKRCRNKFNISIPCDRIGLIVTSGVTSSKRFKDIALLEVTKIEMQSYKWVISDEVEYTVNKGGLIVLELCTNVEHRYGFSATADKVGGRMISFANGLSDIVTRNKDLISYYGPSLIYRVPMHLNINMIDIRTPCFNNVSINSSDVSKDSNIYMTILRKLWMNYDTCDLITRLIKYYPKLFIPINDLHEIIYNWIDNWWKDKYNILLISGRGYIYYEKGLDRYRKVDLSEACSLINNNLVDVIPSTSSGYRALDLPGLENILLIQGKIAGVYIQSIGRVARNKNVNVITLIPDPYRTIPVYTKGINLRDENTRELYKYCKITDITKYDAELI